MDLTLNLPLNSVSFGQVSLAILREFYKQELQPCLFPIGNVDLSAQEEDKDFNEWVMSCLKKAERKHRKTNPVFKLWHLNGSLESYGEKQVLFSFYELDSPTEEELNVVRNNSKVLFSSEQSVKAFQDGGCENVDYVPLAFDSTNFRTLKKEYYDDDRIVFLLVGKYEKRKGHTKVLEAWAKKYGDNKDYLLSCAVYNPFFKPEDNNKIISAALGGKKYFNIQFLGFMPKNALYNDYLNSGNVAIAMSGGEGWALPEFHATALGKHSIVLNEHGHKGWANAKNSTLVAPSEKIPAEDGIFFKDGQHFNQGNIYDFDKDSFIEACEKTVKKVKKDRVNKEGLKLQSRFTYKKTADKIIKALQSL